eukprot:TRINITY_DN9594_c2_g1_i1.p1 TRINITY_DN9594_c2_g1~~TRINITY_DN9594_c2_g1_i1.p1  ORF type:complete len:254 (-),score=46.48 TRINITY_DN9594_c2_g1_i1:146-880(-)
MALARELDPSEQQGSLSDESKGVTFGELIRDYEPMPDTKWRFGKPNYARVNKLYFENRSMNHSPGSLEAVVTNLVKNWEVESHHIASPHQWRTMDVVSFQIAVNGGCPANAQLMADIGPYNALIGETADYSGHAQSFEDSNKNFSAAFPEGFAWEVLEVFSGPPTVSFKWRHFGKMTGTFTDKQGNQHKGNGQMLDLIGMCLAKVNGQLQIVSLDVYYSPNDLIKPLLSKRGSPVVAVRSVRVA